MKVAGIWIDRKEAMLYFLGEEEIKLESMSSGIEDFNPKGGARSKQAWGSNG